MDVKDKIRELAADLAPGGEYDGYRSVCVGLAAVVYPNGKVAQAQLIIQLDETEWIEEPEELGAIHMQ